MNKLIVNEVQTLIKFIFHRWRRQLFYC